MAERAPTGMYDRDSCGPRTPERSREEASLAELARGGDRDAFGQLYARYADYVRGYVGGRVRDQSAVEDVANTAWLGAWKSLSTRSEPLQGEFREWLMGIARNKVANHHGEAMRHGHYSLDDVHEAAHGGQLPDLEPADPRARVEERGVARVELARLAEQLRSMPASESAALMREVRDRYDDVEPLMHRVAVPERRPRGWLREHPGFPEARERVRRGELSVGRAAAAIGVPETTFWRAMARERVAAERAATGATPRGLEVAR
jgi:DNA-directed RNA polymerase specialized sigma24 family protein